MYNPNYSKICYHSRLIRIDNNFVRCMECGQSIVSPKVVLGNKTRKQFTDENKTFNKNNNRNFTNLIEQMDHQSNIPRYEYYTDKNMANVIIVNRTSQFNSDPPIYEVIINGQKVYISDGEIKKLLTDTNVLRVDKELIESKYGKKY